jgi:hypothetical protein
VMYYLLPYVAAFPVIAMCYDHLVAKIDTTHECIVCAYDPRFTVQCISRLWKVDTNVTGFGTLQGTNVVIHLRKDSRLLGKGFHVFSDSFFF